MPLKSRVPYKGGLRTICGSCPWRFGCAGSQTFLYQQNLYPCIFLNNFWGFFRILRAKSIFHNGLRNVFSEQSPPNPQKNQPAASAGLKGVCLKLLCRYAYQMTAHICTLYIVYISSIHYLHHEYSTKKNSLRKFLEQIPVGDFLFKSQIDSKTYR